MNRTLAGTDLSASAVHAIVEIGAAGRLSSKDLSEKLLLEKSTVSRLVRSLIERGEVRESRSPSDARRKELDLTRQGRRTLAAITSFAEGRVEAAVAPLEATVRREILNGLVSYSAALRHGRICHEFDGCNPGVNIKEGYVPGIVARIVEMHMAYYTATVGFGVAFEARVAGDLAEFIRRRENSRNGLWYAERNGRIVGSVAIDGEDLGEGRAHLRWFIVDDGLRGAGVGRALLRQALRFCDDQAFSEIHLWTFQGLDAARRLYEKNGFRLTEEYHGDQWGSEVLEQKFVRPFPS